MYLLFAKTVLLSYCVIGYHSIDQSILNELNEIDLNDYFNTELTKTCPSNNNDALIVTGINVKLSDFIRSNGKLFVELCPNITFKAIKVFVLCKLFIDMDVDMVGEEIVLSIVAPSWIVLGLRKINLNGANGNSPHPLIAESGKPVDVFYRTTYYNAKCLTCDGKHGSPGLPGGPAGSFFGMGDLFIKGYNLEITADGGNGGPGQKGGNGADLILTVPEETSFVDFRDRNLKSLSDMLFSDYAQCRRYQSYTFKNISKFKNVLNGQESAFTVHCFEQESSSGLIPETLQIFEIYQYFHDTDIGRPGNGGKGGQGGLAGTISVVELGTGSFLKHSNRPGFTGLPGKGGTGGNPGGTTKILVHKIYPRKVVTASTSYQSRYIGSSYSRVYGMEDNNSVGIKNRKSPTTLQPIYTYINEYKSFLRESFNHSKRKDYINSLYSKIDESKHVKDNYDTKGFIEEYEGLEEQFYLLNKVVDFIPFYSLFSNRVVEYLEKRKGEKDFKQEKKTMLYIHSSLLGKLLFLKKHSQSVLVVRLGEFLQLTKEKFNEIITLKESYGIEQYHNMLDNITLQKLDTISVLRETYNSKIVKEIENADTLIKTRIMPDIMEINHLATDSWVSLKKEIKEMEKDLLEAEKEAVHERNKAIGKLVGHLLGNSLSLAGTALLLINPAIGIAALGLFVAGNVIKTGFNEMKIEKPDEIKLQKSVEEFDNNRKKIMQKEIAHIEDMCDKLHQMASENPKLNDFSRKLHEVKAFVKNVTSFSGLKDSNVALVNAIKNAGEISKSQYSFPHFIPHSKKILSKSSKKKKKEKKDDEMDTLKNASELGIPLTNLIVDLIKDGMDIHALNVLISEIRKKIKKLREFELSAYDLLIPLLDKVSEAFIALSQNMSNFSQVALCFSSYEIQKTMESIFQYITSYFTGFDTVDKIKNDLKKIQGALSVLIQVYTQIHSFVDQISLSNQLADLFSTMANNVIMSNIRYKKVVDDLQITISSNMVLMYYQSAVHAFKQFVFPFAHDYFYDMILPKHFQTRHDLHTTVLQADEQIRKLIRRLALYRSTLGSNRGMTGNCSFNSFDELNKPFYSWKNDQNLEMISKLLSGEEVTAYADITESDPLMDAVKFNEIGINIKSKNQTVQNEINYYLKNFEITLRHFGNSFYRYNKKIYLLTSSSFTIWLSFANTNGIPARASTEYYQLKQGDYMLSPYALWNLKITHIDDGTSFDKLKVYENEVDIELIGAGTFIDNRRIQNSDLKEDLYYEVFEKDKTYI